MDIDVGEVVLDVVEQFLVPLQLEVGMQPALHQDLVAAERDRLPDLLQQHLSVQDVRLGVVELAVKRAEIADRRANIRIVDIAVDIVGAIGLGMKPLAHGVGGSAQFQQ